MPQSSKDSKGGKTHSDKKGHSKGQASGAAAEKKDGEGRNANSPTGPHKHGEKKTTR